MVPASKKQKQRIAILTKNDKELKRYLVQLATQDEAKISTNDLTHAQANAIITKLGGKPLYYDNWALFNKDNKQHLQILSLCIQYGWSTHDKSGREIADIGQLSEWLKHHSKCPIHKKLKDMNTAELSKVILALEGMVKWKFTKKQ